MTMIHNLYLVYKTASESVYRWNNGFIFGTFRWCQVKGQSNCLMRCGCGPCYYASSAGTTHRRATPSHPGSNSIRRKAHQSNDNLIHASSLGVTHHETDWFHFNIKTWSSSHRCCLDYLGSSLGATHQEVTTITQSYLISFKLYFHIKSKVHQLLTTMQTVLYGLLECHFFNSLACVFVFCLLGLCCNVVPWIKQTYRLFRQILWFPIFSNSIIVSFINHSCLHVQTHVPLLQIIDLLITQTGQKQLIMVHHIFPKYKTPHQLMKWGKGKKMLRHTSMYFTYTT